jgi:hypothetical protein
MVDTIDDLYDNDELPTTMQVEKQFSDEKE